MEVKETMKEYKDRRKERAQRQLEGESPTWPIYSTN